MNQANKNGDTPLAQALLVGRRAIAEMLREAWLLEVDLLFEELRSLPHFDIWWEGGRH